MSNMSKSNGSLPVGVGESKSANPGATPRAGTADGAGESARTRDFTPQVRVEFLNECFEKARLLLPGITTTREFLYLVIAATILIDKRRLEMGVATDRIAVSMDRSMIRVARIAAGLVARSRGRNQKSRAH